MSRDTLVHCQAFAHPFDTFCCTDGDRTPTGLYRQQHPMRIEHPEEGRLRARSGTAWLEMNSGLRM